MGPPISAFPMTPSAPAITIAAAGDATRELKRGKNTSGRAFATSRGNEERLKRRSNKMAKEFQGAMEKSVKRKLNSMSGSQNNRKLGLKVAQFIPGKGLEVAGAQVENDPTIYCSLGLKGEKHVDPLDETFTQIKGRQVSMDFAFKLINDNSTLMDHDKETRVTAMNCFRHVNPDSFNYDVTGWHKNVSASTAVLRTITVTAPGEYSSTSGVPVVTVSIPGGTWATPTLVSSTTPGLYEVSSIEVTTAGTGYTSQPIVTFHVGSNTTELVPAAAQADLLFIDDDKADSNINWHSTLGPDASLIRVGTHGKSSTDQLVSGTWRGPRTSSGHIFGTLDFDPSAAANTLISPFRYPDDLEIMYSRLNRQVLENYGWMLNPFKFVNFQKNSSSPSGYTPDKKQLEVWSNPAEQTLDYVSANRVNGSEKYKKSSFPAQVNTRPADVTSLESSAGFEWHSQFGPGKLNYQFSNDGTNPVCIDICVVGIKKDTPVAVDVMEHICNYNYAIHKFANKGATNLNGFQSTNPGDDVSSIDLDFGSKEWHKNAKLPFMPDSCFKNPQSYLEAANVTPAGVYADLYKSLEQGKKNPFKVVKRDQFIVSSGSSRAWNTTLPSIKYRPQLYDNVEYPLDLAGITNDSDYEATADEYTFVLCIGASGMPKPVEEVYTSVKPYNNNGAEALGHVDMKTIIDRQPSTCNVSVVGTYKETIYPTFPKDRSSVNFINGRLTEPYFETSPGLLVPNPNEALASRVNTVDISQLGQVVHTTTTGVIGVGALNTDVGA